MKKIHIAIGTHQFEKSIKEYNHRLKKTPDLIINDSYALWRTDFINFSLRFLSEKDAVGFRHMGWEDEGASSFTSEVDCNGIIWENFNAEHQANEINELWKDTNYIPKI